MKRAIAVQWCVILAAAGAMLVGAVTLAQTTATAPTNATQAAPAPVKPPAAAAYQQALKEIEEVFKTDYADRRPEGRQALADKLLEQAEDAAAVDASRYVLYREAARLAAGVGDVAAVQRAADQLESLYAVDALALRAELIDAIATSARPDAQRQLVEALLDLAERGLEQDNVGAATKALTRAQSVARAVNDAVLLTLATQRLALVGALQLEAPRTAEARKVLEKSPDDRAANGTVGRQLAIYKGDWDAGLPYLAKGDVAALADVAARELAIKDIAAAEPKTVAAIADAWWDAAEGLVGLQQPPVREHAAGLYELCVDRLDGIARKKAEQRIATAYGNARKYDPAQLPRILTSQSWQFVWPTGDRSMRFGANGAIVLGANVWEHTYRFTADGKLELQWRDRAGAKRYAYDPERNYFYELTKDKGGVSDGNSRLLPLSRPTVRQTARDVSLLKKLQAGDWDLRWGPGPMAHKHMAFGLNGQIIKGNNNNEHSYRVVGGKIEVLQRSGYVFCRYVYDPQRKRWVHTSADQPDTFVGYRNPAAVQTLTPLAPRP